MLLYLSLSHKFYCKVHYISSLQLLSTHVSLDQVVIPQVVQRYSLGLGNSSDSVTIVIVSVTITTVIGKNYYHDSGHVVMSMCI